MNGGVAPPTPEQAARNRRIIVAIAVVFVAACVGVSVWARIVVKDAEAEARRTDAALRSAAWSILCYAASNGGAFPTTAAQAGTADSTGGAPVPGGKPWPSSRDAAMAGLQPVAFVDASSAIGITWGATPDVVPNLNTKGRPSTVGTVDAVNGWLAEYARERMRAPAGPAPRSDKQ